MTSRSDRTVVRQVLLTIEEESSDPLHVEAVVKGSLLLEEEVLGSLCVEAAASDSVNEEVVVMSTSCVEEEATRSGSWNDTSNGATRTNKKTAVNRLGSEISLDVMNENYMMSSRCVLVVAAAVAVAVVVLLVGQAVRL